MQVDPNQSSQINGVSAAAGGSGGGGPPDSPSSKVMRVVIPILIGLACAAAITVGVLGLIGTFPIGLTLSIVACSVGGAGLIALGITVGVLEHKRKNGGNPPPPPPPGSGNNASGSATDADAKKKVEDAAAAVKAEADKVKAEAESAAKAKEQAASEAAKAKEQADADAAAKAKTDAEAKALAEAEAKKANDELVEQQKRKAEEDARLAAEKAAQAASSANDSVAGDIVRFGKELSDVVRLGALEDIRREIGNVENFLNSVDPKRDATTLRQALEAAKAKVEREAKNGQSAAESAAAIPPPPSSNGSVDVSAGGGTPPIAPPCDIELPDSPVPIAPPCTITLPGTPDNSNDNQSGGAPSMADALAAAAANRGAIADPLAAPRVLNPGNNPSALGGILNNRAAVAGDDDEELDGTFDVGSAAPIAGSAAAALAMAAAAPRRTAAQINADNAANGNGGLLAALRSENPMGRLRKTPTPPNVPPSGNRNSPLGNMQLPPGVLAVIQSEPEPNANEWVDE